MEEMELIMNEENLMKIATKSAEIVKKLPSLTSWRTWHFRQHVPAFIDVEPFEMDFTRISDVLAHEDIKWWSTQPKFYGYFINHVYYDDQSFLMALSDYQEEFYGCMSWYCLGTITGEGKGSINLDNANPKYGIHKPTCWKRKYESVERDLLGRPEKEIIDILKKTWMGKGYL